MRGLLIKDMQLIWGDKKTLAIFTFIGALWLFTCEGTEKIMAVGFVVLMFGMLVMTTIAMDAWNGGEGFLMTLPISRRLYAIEKHIFSYLCIIFSGVVMSALATAMIYADQPNLITKQWFLECGILILAGILFSTIMAPMQIKFGADKGRMVILGMIAVVYLVAWGGNYLLRQFHIDSAALLDRISTVIDTIPQAGLMAILIAAYLIVIVLTMRISIHIVEKREY